MKYRIVLLVLFLFILCATTFALADETHLTSFEDGQLGETWYDNRYFNITTGGSAEIRNNVVYAGIKSFGQNATTNPEYNFTFDYMEGEDLISFDGWFFTYENDTNYTFSWKNDTNEIIKFVINNTALTPIYGNGTGESLWFTSKERGDWKYFGWEQENDTWCRYFVDNQLSGNNTNGSNIGGDFKRITGCNVTNDGGALYFDNLRYVRTGYWKEPDDVYNALGADISVAYVYYYFDVYDCWNTIGAGFTVVWNGSTPEPNNQWNSMGSSIYINYTYSDVEPTYQWNPIGVGISSSTNLLFLNMEPANATDNHSRFGQFVVDLYKGGDEVSYDTYFQISHNNSPYNWSNYGYEYLHAEPNVTLSNYFSFGYDETIYWRIMGVNDTLLITTYSDIYHFTTEKLNYNTTVNDTWNTLGTQCYVNFTYNETEPTYEWTTMGIKCITTYLPPPDEPSYGWQTVGADLYVNFTYNETESDSQWVTMGSHMYVEPGYSDSLLSTEWKTLGGLAVVVPPELYVDDDYTVATPQYGVKNFSTIADALWLAHLRAGKFQIYVYNGTYVEWDLEIEKDTDIIGNSSADTQVWGGYVGQNHIFDIHDVTNDDTDFKFKEGVNISGLTISGAGGCGIAIDDMNTWQNQSINISQCYFVYNRDEHIKIDHCRNANIWNNTFYNDITTNDTTAIFLNNTINGTIIDNLFQGNGTMDYAIHVNETNNVAVWQNYINNTEKAGVLAEGNTSITPYTNPRTVSWNDIDELEYRNDDCVYFDGYWFGADDWYGIDVFQKNASGNLTFLYNYDPVGYCFNDIFTDGTYLYAISEYQGIMEIQANDTDITIVNENDSCIDAYYGDCTDDYIFVSGYTGGSDTLFLLSYNGSAFTLHDTNNSYVYTDLVCSDEYCFIGSTNGLHAFEVVDNNLSQVDYSTSVSGPESLSASASGGNIFITNGTMRDVYRFQFNGTSFNYSGEIIDENLFVEDTYVWNNLLFVGGNDYTGFFTFEGEMLLNSTTFGNGGTAYDFCVQGSDLVITFEDEELYGLYTLEYDEASRGESVNISHNNIYNCGNGTVIKEYSNVTFVNNTIWNCITTGIHLPFNTTQVDIIEVTIGETPRGIHYGGGRGLNISNCYIYNWSNYGINIEGEDNEQRGNIDDIWIDGTTMLGGGGTCGVRIYVEHPNCFLNNTNISFCNISNCGQYGIYIDDNQKLHATMGENSTMENISIYAVYLYNNTVAIQNEFVGGSYEYVPVKNVSIKHCEMGLNDAMGIRLEDVENATIYSNTIHNTTSAYEVVSLYGIMGLNASWNLIENNSNGILCDGTDNFTVFSNTVYQNGFGIEVKNADNGIIWNNFFNNTVNAYKSSNTNVLWNITKTLGTNIIGGPYLCGNYWSNYTGWDSNWDGIGEQTYTIPTGP